VRNGPGVRGLTGPLPNSPSTQHWNDGGPFDGRPSVSTQILAERLRCSPYYASTIKKYRCSQTFGDRYAGEWVVEGFRKYGVHYEECEQTRSELYFEHLAAD